MAARRELTIEEKIAKAQETVVQTKEKYDKAVVELEELLAKQRTLQSEKLLKLFANSSRTYDEVAAFLKERITEEQLAKNLTKRKERKPRNRSKEICVELCLEVKMKCKMFRK